MDEEIQQCAHETSQCASQDAAPENRAAAPLQDGDENFPSKKGSFRGSAYDLRGVEQWLAERAAAGEELIAWNEFRIGEESACRFYLEPAAQNDDPDETLRERRALLGWKYVCRTEGGIFYVWRGDALARVPSPREQTNSYGYRQVCKKLRRSYYEPLIYLAGFAALIVFWINKAPLPLQMLIVMEKSGRVQFASLLMSAVLAILSGAQERKNIRALKRAMENGEHVAAAGRDRWSRVRKVLSVCFIALLIASVLTRDSRYGEDYDEPPALPYVSAAQLGGEAAEYYNVRELRTLLGGSVYAVGEPPRASGINGWKQYSTEADVYRLRLAFLAGPLMHELRDYFMTEQLAQPLEQDGFDEAYYYREAPGSGRLYYDGGIPAKGWEVQYLLLRRGGQVLFYRAETPEDLRDHPDEFAQLFAQYEALDR